MITDTLFFFGFFFQYSLRQPGKKPNESGPPHVTIQYFEV